MVPPMAGGPKGGPILLKKHYFALIFHHINKKTTFFSDLKKFWISVINILSKNLTQKLYRSETQFLAVKCELKNEFRNKI